MRPNAWQVFQAKQSRLRASRGRRGLPSRSAAKLYRKAAKPRSRTLCKYISRQKVKQRRPRASFSKLLSAEPRLSASRLSKYLSAPFSPSALSGQPSLSKYLSAPSSLTSALSAQPSLSSSLSTPSSLTSALSAQSSFPSSPFTMPNITAAPSASDSWRLFTLPIAKALLGTWVDLKMYDDQRSQWNVLPGCKVDYVEAGGVELISTGGDIGLAANPNTTLVSRQSTVPVLFMRSMH